MVVGCGLSMRRWAEGAGDAGADTRGDIWKQKGLMPGACGCPWDLWRLAVKSATW